MRPHPRIAGALLTAALVGTLGTWWLGRGVPILAQPAAGDPALTLLARDGSRSLPLTILNGQEMVSLADLATVFRLTVHEDQTAGGLTVSYGDRTIVLSEGQTLASIAGSLVSLPAPTVRGERGWLVPVEFMSRALSQIYDSPIELRRASRLAIVGELRVPRVTVRHSTVGGESRVAFQVRPATPHTISEEPGRLIVRFEAHALDSTLPTIADADLVEAIRIAEPRTAIAIELTPRYGSFRSSEFSARGSASQFVLEIVPAGTETMTSLTPAPSSTPAAGAPPFAGRSQTDSVRTIVIDPGHGGEDSGAQGPAESLEKDITMSVARRLKRALEGQLGARVLLTRNGDEMVRLDERAAVANNNKADLLLSLHVNHSPRPVVRGAEIFYASLQQYGEEARASDAIETRVLPVFGGGTRPIEVVLWEMAQARHLDRSGALARIVEEQLRSRVEMSPRAVQEAPFRVLVGANMPAVLVEMGFISNPDEEQLLGSGSFHASVVQALVGSVVRFRRYVENESRVANREASREE